LAGGGCEVCAADEEEDSEENGSVGVERGDCDRIWGIWRLDEFRERAMEPGRDDKGLERFDRLDAVEGAPDARRDARRDTAGDGGAGRLDVREFRADKDGGGVEGGVEGKKVEPFVGVVRVDDISWDGDCTLVWVGAVGTVGVVPSSCCGDGGGCEDDDVLSVGVTMTDGEDEDNRSVSFSSGGIGVCIAFCSSSSLTGLFFLLVGGGFIANSCTPGMGGGRKDDEGEGKGDDEESVSTANDNEGCGCCSDENKRGVSELIVTRFKPRPRLMWAFLSVNG
jgi:hypothetical protein